MKKLNRLHDAKIEAASKNGAHKTCLFTTKVFLWLLLLSAGMQKKMYAQAPPYPLGQAPACMKTNTLPINTGWDYVTNTSMWLNQPSKYWRIISAEGTPFPVCAINNINWLYSGNWQSAPNGFFYNFPNLHAISNVNSGDNSENNTTCWGNIASGENPFIFRRSFYVDNPAGCLITINMSLGVDDGLDNVKLNGNIIPFINTNLNQSGSINNFNSIPLVANPGINHLDFDVRNRNFNFPNCYSGTSRMALAVSGTIDVAGAALDIIDNQHYVPNTDIACDGYTQNLFIEEPKLQGICVNLPDTTGTVTITNYNPAFNYTVTPATPLTGNSFTANVGTAYTVTVSDAFGCSLSTVFNMAGTSNPPLLTMDNSTYCLPGPLSSIFFSGTIANGTSPYVYNISPAEGPINGNDTLYAGFVLNGATGTFTVTATDIEGCTGTATFAVGNVLTVSIVPANSQYCIPAGGSINLIATATPNGNVNGYSLNGGAFQANNIFSVNTAGIYTITAKDIYGCTGSSTIEVFLSPNVTVSQSGPPCSPMFTAAPQGLVFSWGLPPYNPLITNNELAWPQMVIPYVAGQSNIYIVMGTDANGCTSVTSINWEQNPLCCTTNDPLAGNVFSSFPIFNNGTATAVLSFYGNPPGNIISTNDILFFDGNIVLDQDISFVNCPQMQFTQNTKFVLNPNVNLTIDNCVLRAKCQDLWSGITAGISPVNNSIHISNSTLRDMKDGIIANNSTPLILTNNNFTDNYMSVQIGNTTPPYNLQTGNCVITDNTFRQVNNFLLFPHNMQDRGERAIVLVNCREVEIGDLNAPGYSNTFENLFNGIYIMSTVPTMNQEYHIHNNHFNNIVWGQNNWWGNAHWKVNNWAQAGSQAHRGVAIYGMRVPNMPIPNQTVHIKYPGTDNPGASFNQCDKAVMLHGLSARIEKARVSSTLMGFMMNRADGQEFTITDNDLENNISQAGFVDHLYKGIKIAGNNGNSEISHNLIFTAPIDLPMGANHIVPAAIEIEHPNAANTALLYIHHNNMTHYAPTGNGIYLRNVQQQNIIRLNYVHLYNTQGPATFTGIRAAGIQLDNCKFTQVLGNIVSGNMTLLASANHFDAMRMQSSNECIPECNILSYTPRGLRVIGDNTTPSTMIRGNSCVNHGRGWYFQNLGAVEAGFGNVGSPAEDNRNMFFNSTLFGGGYGIWRDGNGPYWGRIYTTLFGLSFSGANPIGARYFVQQNPGAAKYECDYTVYTPPVWWFANMGIDEEEAAQIINDSLQNNNMEENVQWALEQELIYALERDEQLRNSNITLQNYYTSHSSSNMGILARVNTQLARIYDSNAVNNYTKFVTQLQLIDSMNASLNSPNEAESNTQTINRYYLKWLTGGIDSLSSDETDTLAGIAALCPVIWGNAVIRARAMYDNAAQVQYNDLYTCAGLQNKNSNYEEEKTDLNMLRAIAENKITLYPNPVNEILTIDYVIQMDSKTILQIMDMTGKVVIETTLSPVHNRTTLSMKNLSKGLYMYKVTESNQILQTGKLIKE